MAMMVDAQSKAVPAPFLTKTYQLVEDSSTNHIVSWGEDDDSTFVVWRPPEFARDLLPNYFKHNNFSSFVRQLNTYGFRKIVPDRWEFANEFFKRGEKQLLCEIHRRKTSQPLQQPPLSFSGPNFFSLPLQLNISPSHTDHYWCNSPPSPPRSIVNHHYNHHALMEENERLRRSNVLLTSELAHMKKLYNDIIYFVQNHVKPVAPSSVLLNHSFLQQKKLLLGKYNTATCIPTTKNVFDSSSPPTTSQSSMITVLDDNGFIINREINTRKTKLFGVSLSSSTKKRFHSENTKTRLALEKSDLVLDLMTR